ncbi:KAP family P-loop NTPase fold protein [Nocardioides ganghwensis]|uniref:KAP family P-loop NTPase fold protein n=1 Tax=Nocardioides ganghwensis TaxID=252230 RepID=UPI0013ECC896|nr:KAP family NTPase [Nocardioides ganghwensis]MBD3944783.1 KAP family NTPase [Nocardioides ganghwensis]
MSAPWNDDAVTSADEDKFGRAGWAARQAGLIDDSHAIDSSLVYGLEGPWGSGKSSVLSMIEDALDALAANWHVVYFTPWATSTQEELFSEFFAALSSAIPPDNEGHQQVHEKLGAYGKVAIPLLGVVPVVGKPLAESVDRLSAKLAKPWKTVFEDLAASLEEAELKILVVVDDIDRLSPDELLTLLKVVRLIGRLPGIDYLLAYDEKTLAETLTAARLTNAISTAHARQFMEKIVQYPIQLPPMLESVVIRLFMEGLNALPLRERSVDSLNTDVFHGVVSEVMIDRLSTPRAMGRYLAQLRHAFDVVDQGEFDACDLALITFMRLHFPDMHRALKKWRTELTGGGTARTFAAALAKGDDAKDAWKQEFFSIVETSEREDASRLATAIFSRLGTTGAATVRFDGVEQNANDAANRMENSTYFDRYIVFEVPDGDVPDGELTGALTKASEGNTEALRTLVLAEDDDKSLLVMTRINRRYGGLEIEPKPSSTDAPVSVDLIKAAASMLGTIQENPHEFVSRRRYLIAWVATLVRAQAELSSYEELQSAFDSCTSYARRIEVLWKLKNAGKLSEAAASLRDKLFDTEGERAATVMLEHLATGDTADLDVPTQMLISVILDSAASDSFSREVKNRIDSGILDLATVASRCVVLDSSREQYVLGNVSLQQVTGEYLEQVAEYVGTDDDSPLPIWSLQQRREWMSAHISTSASQEERPAVEPQA